MFPADASRVSMCRGAFLVVAGALAALLLGTPELRAESPSEAAPGGEARQTAGSGEAKAGPDKSTAKAEELGGPVGHRPMLWFYLAALGMAGLIPVGYFLYRRSNRAYAEMSDEMAAPKTPPTPPSHEISGASAPERAGSSKERAVFSLKDTEINVDAASTSRAAMTSERSRGGRICPECGRHFDTSMVVCPHDASPLRSVESTGNNRRSRAGKASERRQRCPGCGRRFEAGPDYCYHDGMRLVADSVEQAEEAPVFKVCDRCGWEGRAEREDRELCPRDGAELTLVDPSRERRQSPSIPLMVCPECGEYGTPGQARCPEDDAVLTPLQYPHARALPSRGVGPRRKICQECGQDYGGAAEYCSNDGHQLTTLN